MRPQAPVRRNACLLAATLVLLIAGGTAAQEPDPIEAQPFEQRAEPRVDKRLQRDEAIGALDSRHQQWLASVNGLITVAELDYFLGLDADYRRDAFMEAFWDPRDPDRATRGNELRERWQELRDSSGGVVGTRDARVMAYLLNGPPGRWSLPDGRPVGRCFARSRELEIWFYGASELTPRRFVLIFYQAGSQSPYEAWIPGKNMRAIQRSQLPSRDIGLMCADELMDYAQRHLQNTSNYEMLVEDLMTPPTPSPEWLASFRASTAELPTGAETFPATFELDFPARNQSRTALQVLVRVPLSEAPGRNFDGELFHNFQVIGEVIRDGRLFEGFRYRFEGPTPPETSEVPIGFTRFVRPGAVMLKVLVEDVFGNRFAHFSRVVDVPSPEGLPSLARAISQAEPSEGDSLRLIVPGGEMHSGMVRFQTRARGELDKVTFFLDDRPVITKRKAPYSIELNLGDVPAAHRVRVVGYRGDEEVASDQVWLNQGAQRFRVRMIEPRPGGIYPGSLTARIEVDTPDGGPPERLELWLGEDLLATLHEPPFEQSILLPSADLAVVRAVAYLADGTSAEDVALVNHTDFATEIRVQLVEVHTLVLDSSGQAIDGLTQEDFRVLEDGVPQQIERFELARDQELHAALLMDRSISMDPHLDRVAQAALGFADATLEGGDRIAVLSFADDHSVDSGFSGGSTQVERALAGLDADGRTALYDSVVQSLNYFDGVRGQKSLVLFSDGQDETSRLTLDNALESAGAAGVTIFSVALAESYKDKEARRALRRLAEETGGAAFFLDSLDQIDEVYAAVLDQLRSSYLLAYQSTSEKHEAELREIRVEVDRRGVEVRAMSGYYP